MRHSRRIRSSQRKIQEICETLVSTEHLEFVLVVGPNYRHSDALEALTLFRDYCLGSPSSRRLPVDLRTSATRVSRHHARRVAQTCIDGLHAAGEPFTMLWRTSPDRRGRLACSDPSAVADALAEIAEYLKGEIEDWLRLMAPRERSVYHQAPTARGDMTK